jgi:hypothetical protein
MQKFIKIIIKSGAEYRAKLSIETSKINRRIAELDKDYKLIKEDKEKEKFFLIFKLTAISEGINIEFINSREFKSIFEDLYRSNRKFKKIENEDLLRILKD